jgi:hypothetical protein
MEEEGVVTHHSSPEKLGKRASVIEIQDSNASFSDDDNQS